jgi:hypothetical protein
VTLDGETIVLPVVLTGDGLTVDVALPMLAADFDGDGGVDQDDLLRWQAGLGAGIGRAQGDADGDNDVDGADFLVWQRQLGRVAPQSAVALVPERSRADRVQRGDFMLCLRHFFARMRN